MIKNLLKKQNNNLLKQIYVKLHKAKKDKHLQFENLLL